MNGKKFTGAIIAVILVLLIVGGLLYNRTVEKQREAEEQERTAEQARIQREAEAERRKEELREVPEAPEAQVPEEVPRVPIPEEVARPGLAVPAEPAVEPVMPPPIAAAGCKADSLALAKKRGAGAPEGMVYVAGGAFIMGSQPGVAYADESPARNVCLNGFYIDRHEITNAKFKEFADATGYVTDAEDDPSSASGRTWRHPYGPESNAEDMPNHPVVCVSWNDANAYAQWVGKRLPTEAEWEKAARGTDGRVYPWGNSQLTGALANIADKSSGLKWSNTSLDDGHKMAAPVGSFPKGKSVYGAEDMAGNVWEWCRDWADINADYYKTSPSQNPAGPQTGEFKVIRGGSWFYSADGARTAQRMYFRPRGNSAAIGFRCVKDAG